MVLVREARAKRGPLARHTHTCYIMRMTARYGLVILAILLVGCEERISKLEKQNQELLADVKKNHAAADYDLQAKCSRDSKVWFNETWRPEKSTLLLTYTNHYNKKLNKCFILVQFHYSLTGLSWVNHEALWDVYENNEYGDVSVTHMIYEKPDFRDDERVGQCKVYGSECKTLDGFNNLVRPYVNE